jgi:hypothetical protein
MQTYTVTSMGRKLNLRERAAYVGQPFQGIVTCIDADGFDALSVISTQRWMLWRASNPASTSKSATASKVSSTSANGWVLQAVGGSGGLLDSSRKFLKLRPRAN